MAYSYNPKNIAEIGKDRMRFELGDVMVEGGVETCALTDEEYNAILSKYTTEREWKRAKYKILQSIVMRFSYEVDTKVGPLSLNLAERAKRWEKMLDDLKAEMTGETAVPTANPQAISGEPIFYKGMHDNRAAGKGSGHDVH